MDSPLPILIAAQKDLLIGVQWVGPDEDGKLEFVAPLSISGRTIGGLWLRGTCIQRLPNENVMFQLEAGLSGVRTRTPLIRLEWRPLAQPHKNPPDVDSALSDTMIWGTHVHPFELNWLLSETRMRSGNLPYAVEIVPDFDSFETFIDFAKDLFNINGLETIERPLWSVRLF